MKKIWTLAVIAALGISTVGCEPAATPSTPTDRKPPTATGGDEKKEEGKEEMKEEPKAEETKKEEAKPEETKKEDPKAGEEAPK